MMDDKLSSCIEIFDNFLSESECNTLIKIFEDNKDTHEIYNLGNPFFSRLNLEAHKDKLLQHQDLIKTLKIKFQYFAILYREKRKNWVPFPETFEDIRIKKYDNNGKDRFDIHTDSNSLATCQRYLALMVYLNDVEEGGETEFNFLGVKINPKMGKILIFPPFWMFPHAGLMPKTNQKYLLSTYCVFQK